MIVLNENQKPAAALLVENGYREGDIPNEFIKGNHKAVIWHCGDVTVTKYTPMFKRYLWCETANLEGLQEYFDNN